MIAGLSTPDEAGEFLSQIISLYNTGVRTRDFSGFLDLLTEDAVFDFEGVSERGPLSGKTEIALRLQNDPPDDGIEIKRWKYAGSEIVAEFKWADIPEGGGCLFIQPRDRHIARLTIALGGPRCRFRV